METQKLNICLINDSFPPRIDGVANAVVNYARVINGGLGSATVATPYYPDADDSGYGFDVVRYPSIDTTALVGYRAGIPFGPDTISGLAGRGFDLIHSHCPVSATMLARSLRDVIDKPVVMTYHTKFDIDIEKAIRLHILQEGAVRVLADNISACDEVWTVSRGAGDNLRKIGYEGDYIVMPNGVDFPRGRLPEARVRELTSAALKAAGASVPEGVPVFLYVGRMMWYKGIRITIDALRMLAETGRDFRMVFIGGGIDRDEIVEYAASLGLDKLIFLPPTTDREEIRAWYCRADLFLFPSTFDTNGLVVREAAACGLASILVAGSCAAEDSTDGGDSFLIEENSLSMYSKLAELAGDTARMRAAGERAQSSLYLSWEDSVKAAYERYGVVLENYRSGAPKEYSTLSEAMIGLNARAISEQMSLQNWFENVRRSVRSNVLDIFR